LIYRLGTQAQRVVDSIRDQIISGSLPIGAQLPPHKQLADDFKVAPLTARHALAFLETQGLISRQQGRGTFVMSRHRATVLVVDDDADIRELLTEQIQARHCATFSASAPSDGLELLKNHPQISLVISDVRMPKPQDGLRFIRTVRTNYPKLSLAALTGFPEDLTPLLGTSECPILILSKPIFPQHIDDVLKLVVG
jgi:DNA-binding transcriptional regulator YhcF (GntR family)